MREEAALYEKYFPDGGADAKFWESAFAFETALGEGLRKRPIGIMQIKAACRRYSRDFEEACIEAKARGQQARAADQEGREAPA